MPLQWSDILITGHRQIDMQHQELVDLINALDRAICAGGQLEACEVVLPKLHAYVLFHFATEEALFGAADAAHVARHLGQHREFVDKLAQWRASSPETMDSSALLDYLKTWLVEHIMRTDRELANQVSARR